MAPQVVAKPRVTGEGLHDSATTGSRRAVTDSVAGDESTVAPVASVTRNSKVQFPSAVKAQVDTVGFDEGLQPAVKEMPRSLKLEAEGASEATGRSRRGRRCQATGREDGWWRGRTLG